MKKCTNCKHLDKEQENYCLLHEKELFYRCEKFESKYIEESNIRFNFVQIFLFLFLMSFLYYYYNYTELKNFNEAYSSTISKMEKNLPNVINKDFSYSKNYINKIKLDTQKELEANEKIFNNLEVSKIRNKELKESINNVFIKWKKDKSISNRNKLSNNEKVYKNWKTNNKNFIKEQELLNNRGDLFRNIFYSVFTCLILFFVFLQQLFSFFKAKSLLAKDNNE